jgi:hypothetical protein
VPSFASQSVAEVGRLGAAESSADRKTASSVTYGGDAVIFTGPGDTSIHHSVPLITAARLLSNAHAAPPTAVVSPTSTLSGARTCARLTQQLRLAAAQDLQAVPAVRSATESHSRPQSHLVLVAPRLY